MDAKSTHCSAHKTKAASVRGCRVCARLRIEADIITRTVDAMIAAGYALATNQGDGRDANVPSPPTRDRAVILRELFEVDDEFLGVFADGAGAEPSDEDPNPPARLPFGWVRFVYGNDGYDVISDYTTNLDAVLRPVNDYADVIANGAEV